MQAIQGDPDFVAAQASAILQAAGEIGDASKRLYSLTDGGAKSEAVSSMESNVHQLAGVLTDAAERYHAAGSALAAYAPALRSAMQRVNAAISAMGHTDPGGARRRADEANAHFALVNHTPWASQSDKDHARLEADHATQESEREQHEADLAKSQYDSAIADLNAAAQTAANQIENGVEMSHLNDRFSDHVASVINHVHAALSKILAFIDEVLSDISTALSYVSLGFMALGLLLSAIGLPEFGVAAAAIGDAMGAVATLFQVADLAVNLMQFANGDIKLGDLVVDGLETAAAVILLPIGGKAVSGLALKGVAKTTTTRIADRFLDNAAEFDVDNGFDLFGKDHVSRFLDENFLPFPGMNGLSSPDVGQLTPNFSSLNLDNILRDAGFANPIRINPAGASTYSANVA